MTRTICTLAFLFFGIVTHGQRQKGILAETETTTPPPGGGGLLLDDVTGAGVAGGLYLMDGDYTGPAVTIRRSTDNDTTDIGFTAGYLDTATMIDYLSGADAYTVRVYDQTGGENHFVQPTTTSQPMLTKIAGRWVLDHTGGNNYLISNYSGVNGSAERTIVWVGEGLDDYAYAAGTFASNQDYRFTLGNSSYTLQIQGDNTGNNGPPVGTRDVTIVTHDGSSTLSGTVIWKNDTLSHTNASSAAVNTLHTRTVLGNRDDLASNSSLNGKTEAFIMWPANKTDDVAAIVSFFNN